MVQLNKDITIENKPVMFKSFLDRRIFKINDLIDKDGHVKKFDDFGLSQKDGFSWFQLVTNIKKSKLYTKESDNIDHTVLMVGNTKLEKAYSRQIYKYFLDINQKETPEIRIVKYSPIPKEDQTNIFKWCHNNTIDVASRAFQFKFLYNILINNYWLTKWKIKENNLCTFCQESEENIYHLYWTCPITSNFWSDLELWMTGFTELKITANLVLYGTEDKLIHTLIILAKRSIHESRKNNHLPNLQKYKYQTNYVRKLEFEIARNNNKLQQYIEKWNPLNDNLQYLS